MTGRADLHTHSTRSDGVLDPGELVRQAHAAGIERLALTDHDSVAGIADAARAAAELQVRMVAGVELSVRDAQRNDDHLLGFGIDPTSPALNEYLRRLQASREAMAEHTLVALSRLGLSIDAHRVAELARGAVVTRPHIARAMVEAGYVASEQEAFDRYLGSGKPAAPERPAPRPDVAISAVRDAGGVAGLAHPIFGQDEHAAERLATLPRRLDQLVEAGLRALECFYPDSTSELTERLLELAGERKLIVTGGTDYHGPGKAPNAPLGSVTVDASVVDLLLG